MAKFRQHFLKFQISKRMCHIFTDIIWLICKLDKNSTSIVESYQLSSVIPVLERILYQHSQEAKPRFWLKDTVTSTVKSYLTNTNLLRAQIRDFRSLICNGSILINDRIVSSSRNSLKSIKQYDFSLQGASLELPSSDSTCINIRSIFLIQKYKL